MKIYLDTNIYEMVTDAQAATQLQALLDERAHQILVSGFNLLEAWDHADPRGRTAKVQAMTTIGTYYVHEPETYLQGLQVRAEIQRLRGVWLGRLPDPARQEWVLNQRDAYLSMWASALRDPATRPPPFEYLMHDIAHRKGIAKNRQRSLRLRIPQAEPNRRHRDWDKVEWVDDAGREPIVLSALFQSTDPADQFWRCSAYETYKRVIVARDPSRIDLREWPSPSIRRAIDPAEYAEFWMRLVDGDRVNITKVIGLTEHYQSEYRASPGNLIDLHHAVHLLDCDFFVTADEPFYSILRKVRPHLPTSAVPVLVRPHYHGVSDDLASRLITCIDGAAA